MFNNENLAAGEHRSNIKSSQILNIARFYLVVELLRVNQYPCNIKLSSQSNDNLLSRDHLYEVWSPTDTETIISDQYLHKAFVTEFILFVISLRECNLFSICVDQFLHSKSMIFVLLVTHQYAVFINLYMGSFSQFTVCTCAHALLFELQRIRFNWQIM